MKSFKRKAAIILALCLIITTVMPAFAEGTEEVKPAAGQEMVQDQISNQISNQISDSEIEVTEPEIAATADDEIEVAADGEKTEETVTEETVTEENVPEENIPEEPVEEKGAAEDVQEEIKESSPSETVVFTAEEEVDGIKVIIKADKGVFPESAKLVVSKVDDAKTEDAIEEAVEQKREENTSVAESIKLDIKMFDENGQEIQPDNTKGKFKLLFEFNQKLNDSMNVNVYHIKDDPETKEITDAEVLDIKDDSDTEEFVQVNEDSETQEIQGDAEETGTVIPVEPDGFSFYVIEFSYSWFSYQIDANAEVPLVKILEKLGVKNAKIETASTSNSDYLEIKKNNENEWTVKAIDPDKNPFLMEWIYVDVDNEYSRYDWDYIIMVTLSGTDNPDYRSKMVPVADHLYEVEYYDWNDTKANAIAALLNKANFSDGGEIIPGFLDEEARKIYDYLYGSGLWDDFLDGMTEALNKQMCTSCRNNEFIGRNFDWSYDDVDELVIRVPAVEGRHASIGVASKFFPQFLQDMIGGVDDIIPMLTMDGVNDQGVAINVNVVMGDPEVSGDTTGTNPTVSNSVCAGFIVRYILDNANSAKHAVELLKKTNIFSVITQEFHWMISDSKETYIVETVNNTLSVLQSKGTQAAMSNYHVSHSERCKEYNQYLGQNEKDYSHATIYNRDIEKLYSFSDLYFLYPMGIERYDIVSENLSNVKSEEAMMNNMRKAWYLQGLYHKGNERFWSDHNFYPYKDAQGNTKQFTYYDKDEHAIRARKQTFVDAVKKFEEIKEHEDETGERLPGAVQTVHTSVYNLKTKTLMVDVQERKTSFKFSLKEPAYSNITTMYINHENVGLAEKCDVPGERWVYNKAAKTVTLLDDEANYYIETTGDNDITIVKKGHGGGGTGSGGGSGTSITFFTGTEANPVKDGKWAKDADGDWTFTTSRKFTNTWGCIVNAYSATGYSWYHFDAAGKMQTGWQYLSWRSAYNWYYFSQAAGPMLGACQLGGITPDGFKVDASGAWIK